MGWYCRDSRSRPVFLAQELPSQDRNHRPSRQLDDGQGKVEESHDEGANQHRPQKESEGVRRHAPRQTGPAH